MMDIKDCKGDRSFVNLYSHSSIPNNHGNQRLACNKLDYRIMTRVRTLLTIFFAHAENWDTMNQGHKPKAPHGVLIQ